MRRLVGRSRIVLRSQGSSRGNPLRLIQQSILSVASTLFKALRTFVARVGPDREKQTIVAGNGERGFRGDGGPATAAKLANPAGLVIDSDGNLFISEYVNNRIRRVDAKTKIITTVAGNGLPHRMDVEM